jgi:hypothetical protein
MRTAGRKETPLECEPVNPYSATAFFEREPEQVF